LAFEFGAEWVQIGRLDEFLVQLEQILFVVNKIFGLKIIVLVEKLTQ
jgi:hypothetical protein